MATSSKKAPWDRGNPKKSAATTRELTSAQKTAAKRSAKTAGRPYPNLVDNMRIASKSSKKRPAAKPAFTRKNTTKDPDGGLTAAGRAEFKMKDGANLKPGVTKAQADMTADEMKRKGSWAVRFYGRTGALPPLKTKSGEPTRFALTAAAWGEPVPTTAADARKIAAKGRRLLAEYKRMKQK